MNGIAPSNFSVSIYGELRPYEYNKAMSIARVRTFYKYLNRNGTYFTDEMAETMIANMGGTPVLGHYDYEVKDFSTHMHPKYSKAYGFIPLDNTGFAWEPHRDKDGVLREYACFDVVLWTDRYKEAKEIVGKAQSMELNPDTIVGEWRIEAEVPTFYYTACDVLGLCVLGSVVEPCFEGASFYSKNSQFYDFMKAMKDEIVKNFSTNYENKGGRKKVFKFSGTEETYPVLFNSVNPNFNEEQGFLVDNVVHTMGSTGDYYVYSLTNGTNLFYAADANGEPVAVDHLVPMTEEEKALYSEICKEGVAAVKTQLEDFAAQVAELQATIAAQEEAITAYAAKNFEELEQENETLKQQIAAYEADKAAALDAQKDELIDSYSTLLDEEEVTKYKNEKSKYSLEELEGKLAVLFVRSTRDQSNIQLPNSGFEGNNSPILQLLNAYKNKKGE